MIEEVRRRAYLAAMQVASWLPRAELPFAAPSRPELLQPISEPQPQAPASEPQQVAEAAPVYQPPSQEAPAAAPAARPKIEIARPAPQARQAPSEPEADASAAPASVSPAPAAPPRFALQLLRAGACAVLVELPNGEPFQGRDPAYLLLKDLLRAAALPDSPQLIGEPVRWPLLVRGNMDQGPDAARDFLQTFVAARLEEQAPCSCLWLIGLPAIRFAGEGDEHSYNRELQIDGLGAAWALPGLELLMDEPERKRPLWQAMQRVRARWLTS